jgi:hypothetical protein
MLMVQDGFAGLREQALPALLPAHLLLPQADVSDSQAQRDNAAIAGEVEAAQIVEEPTPKKQYLNDAG